jgi:L-threonylcarbamoyladenylate synthase
MPLLTDVADKLSRPGAVGIIPTDTVYGLVARAADQAAVARLYALKNRDKKPGTIIAASIDQLVELGIKRRYLTAVQQFWPGAVSVIIPCGEPELEYLHQSKLSLAIRLPAETKLRKLLEQTGPLVTSSANLPSEPPANTIAEARKYFGDKVDFYTDGGDLSGRQPSTIIRIIDDAIEIIRKGAVKIDESGRLRP